MFCLSRQTIDAQKQRQAEEQSTEKCLEIKDI